MVWTYEDDRPPKRTSTYKRPFTREGNYLVIPVIIDVHRHRFEIYMLVSEIHENVDLVLGIKNVFKLEGVINSRDCCFKFLNRSVPIFPEKEVIDLKRQKNFANTLINL